MMLDHVTPLIITYNEEPNIGRCLDKLRWATEVLVIDSHSTDGTLRIANDFANVKVAQRAFDTFAGQCNFGISRVRSKWVLAMDADYILSDAFVDEMRALPSDGGADGYFARFVYRVLETNLRGTLYPPRQVLFRRDKGQYTDDGHAHRLVLRGASAKLSSPIYHDDRKSLSRWLTSQIAYSSRESHKLRLASPKSLTLPDRLRKLEFIAPPLVFFYCLLIKGGILDGRAGFYYALQRSVAEIILALRLIEGDRETYLETPDSIESCS